MDRDIQQDLDHQCFLKNIINVGQHGSGGSMCLLTSEHKQCYHHPQKAVRVMNIVGLLQALPVECMFCIFWFYKTNAQCCNSLTTVICVFTLVMSGDLVYVL